MREVEIQCPNCGATTGAQLVAQNIFRCRFCQTQFAVEPDAPPRHAASQHVAPPARRAQQKKNAAANKALAFAILGVSLSIIAGAVVLGIVYGNSSSDSAAKAEHEFHQLQRTSDTTHETPAPAPKLTATFHYDRTVPSNADQYVLGEVRNTSKVPIGAAKVYVVMKDASGKEIASKSGFTAIDHIAPGERVPLLAILTKPPHYAKLAFEVSASRPFMKTARGLRLVKTPPRVGSYGQWVFSGKVINGGTKTAEFVQVEVAALDAHGKLLGVNNDYADGQSLAPGASARFEVTSVEYPKKPRPAKFEYYVWGNQK